MAMSQAQQQFIDMLMPAAIEASKRTGVDPRIIVAQAAQETGWGRSAPGNNYFGVKSHGQGGGNNLSTREFVNGNWVTINDSFRGYESPEDSVSGYADFILQNPRYQPFMEASGDFDRQLQELQASGYATDPGYSSSVGSNARNIPLPNGQPRTATAAINAAAPPVAPQRPQGMGFAAGPMRPPQPKPQGGFGGLIASIGNAANSAVSGMRAAAPPPRQIVSAMINGAVRDAFSNPNMQPSLSQSRGANSVPVMMAGKGGGPSNLNYSSTSSSLPEDPASRAVRMHNANVMRAATGSGAITQDRLSQAMAQGAQFVKRL